MVRLLLPYIRHLYSAQQQFQSHNGAIAADFLCPNDCQNPMFQSHNGAIAANLSDETQKKIINVSIPQWCDCCSMLSCNCLSEALRFNPTMVRLLPSEHNLANKISEVSIPQWCDCCLSSLAS